MATPIKITPILEGDQSVRFNQLLDNGGLDKEVAKEEKKRVLALLKAVLDNQKADK